MQTLILPGYSIKNKAWCDEIADNLESVEIIRPVYWDHWEDQTQNFDVKEKAVVIARHARGEKLNLIAKSVGTLVASLVIEKIPDQINKVIFCGIPVNDFDENDTNTVKKAIASLGDKLIVFQNEHDPHGSYEQIKSFEINFELVKKAGYNHEYPYYEEFNHFLSK